MKKGMQVRDAAYGNGVIVDDAYTTETPLLVKFECGIIKPFTADGRYERLAKPTLKTARM